MRNWARIQHLKNDKKGFTLVELVVVLVILATLLAILVPGMLGWVNRAKEKQITIDARSAYIAAQTFVSEEYGKTGTSIAAIIVAVNSESSIKQISDLAEVSGKISNIQVNDQGKIVGMTYIMDNKTVKWEKESWVIT